MRRLSYMYVSLLSKLTGFTVQITNVLEIIIDYKSAFVTYEKITETKSSQKESSFLAEVILKKIMGVGEEGGKFAVARDSSKNFCFRTTGILDEDAF